MLKDKIFNFTCVLTFLVGGSLQYLGIISYTVSTVILVLLMGFSMILYKATTVMKIPYFFLLAVLILNIYINGTPIILGVYYFMLFILTPFVCFNFIYNYRDKLEDNRVYNFFVIIGLIQLPVLTIQILFADTFADNSRGAFSAHDAGFGTFFMSNDHGLGFFLLCLVTYILYTKEVNKRNIFLITYFCLTILLCNSNISFILLGPVFVGYVLYKNQKRFIRYLGCIFIVFMVLIGAYNFSDTFQKKTDSIIEKTINKDFSDYERWIERGEADRLHIIVYYLNEDLKILGDGPYDYYDPIKKEFSKFGNFSQYLWFYNDLGLIGVLALLLIYWKQVGINKNKLYRYTILGLLLVFSFVTNTLSDLATNLALSIFLLKK